MASNLSNLTNGPLATVEPLETSGPDRPLPVGEAIFIVLVVFSTFIINILVILVITNNASLRNITGYFIIALACSDLLYGACFSFSIPSVIYREWIFGDLFCSIDGYLYNVTYHNSIHSFVFVTIDRYIAITRPLHYHQIMTKNKCFLIIAFGWAVSFVAVSPTIFGFGSFAYRPDVYWCGIAWGNDWRYTVYCTCIFMPDLFAILFCYYSIWRISYEHSQGMQEHQAFHEDMKENRNKALRTLIVMGVSFLNGWFPYLLSMLYAGISPYPIPYSINFAMGWVSTSNSFWDSFLYILSSQPMKQGFSKLFRPYCSPILSCCCCHPPSSCCCPHTSSDHTHNGITLDITKANKNTTKSHNNHNNHIDLDV